MNTSSLTRLREHALIFASFFLPAIYWACLIRHSEAVHMHDAVTFVHLATMIKEQGWRVFLETGPHREPLYPWFISILLWLTEQTAMTFNQWLLLFQFSLLFITQWLAYGILRFIHARKIWIALAIAYIGFSPVLIHSAFIIFSEILTYPLLLGIPLLTVSWLEGITRQENKKFFYAKAAILGFLLTLLVMIKGIFEFTIPFFFVILSCVLLRQHLINKRNLKPFLTGLCVIFLTYALPVATYKSLNKIYNGQYVMTDRGSRLFFGKVQQRTEKPLTFKRFMTAVAFVPSWSFCNNTFNMEDCYEWSFLYYELIGTEEYARLMRLSPHNINERLTQNALKTISKDPVQYALLTFVESWKLFFWESPMMQYVRYPPALVSLYRSTAFNIWAYGFMSLLTLVCLITAVNRLWFQKTNSPRECIVLAVMTSIIIPFAGLQSLITILPRHLLPVVPLLIILIVLEIKNAAGRNNQRISA